MKIPGGIIGILYYNFMMYLQSILFSSTALAKYHEDLFKKRDALKCASLAWGIPNIIPE